LQAACARTPASFPLAVELSENMPASSRAIHLDLPPGATTTGDAVAGAAFTGISVSTVDDPRTLVIAGEPHVTDEFSVGSTRVRFRRHVRAFFQGNRFLLPVLVARVLAVVPAGDDVLDLYAGGGLFSGLAARGGGASRPSKEIRRRVTICDGTAGWEDAADVSPVSRGVSAGLSDVRRDDSRDPPRTGMSEDAATRIRSSGARRIVYVSCDVATLARDVRRLGEADIGSTRRSARSFPNGARRTIAVGKREIAGSISCTPR
jgi:hypothetical protein